MPLIPGTRLGPYEVTAQIEEGGMGQVYRTRDTKLIAKQIAEALEAAHEQGVIHRDLKPARVKVRTDGSRGQDR